MHVLITVWDQCTNDHISSLNSSSAPFLSITQPVFQSPAQVFLFQEAFPVYPCFSQTPLAILSIFHTASLFVISTTFS